jgi:hypothetical protein
VPEGEANRDHGTAAEHHLDDRAAERHVQETPADPRDRTQLDTDDGVRDGQCRVDIADQKGSTIVIRVLWSPK